LQVQSVDSTHTKIVESKQNRNDGWVTPPKSEKTEFGNKVEKPLVTAKKEGKNPILAMCLSAVIPGAGQIYNEQYWYLRVPVIWVGGYLVYNWYNQTYDYYKLHSDLYNDFSYYIEQKKTNPNAKYIFKNEYAYLNGTTIDDETLKKYFESRRDYYLEQRETAMVFLGLSYVIQVLDAYVVAKFTTFDISENLQMKVDPVKVDYNPGTNQESVSMNLKFKF
jgi:hypothetical protein